MDNNTVLFEENYIFRNNKSITSNNDIALTELIANAWDAGAHNVNITIPHELNEIIMVEDDGIGMTDEEFRSRWMTLNYDRQKRQGKDVVFPANVETSKRIAYGRNGIGRHGMLCFSNNYTVETWRDGVSNIYDIAVSHGDAPFKIFKQTRKEKDGHGTKVYTYVNRRLPDADAMTDILSARFLYDPDFCVSINGKKIDLSQHKGIVFEKEFLSLSNAKLSMIVIDSEKTAAKSQQHGIAFWVCGRLVGQPSWTYGKTTFLDGRFKAAKRYTIIIKTDDLIDEVLPDWSGFIDNANMANTYLSVKKEVDSFVKSVMKEHIKGKLTGIGLFSLEILHLISVGKKETLKDIESHLDTADLIEYLSQKYDEEFSIKFDNTNYDNSEINKYFTNYSGYIEGNEDRKYRILNQDDGLLLILALLTDKIERECINWSVDN